MFAVAFPLAPLLAYVNNRFEIVSDFKKLVHARRPPIVIRYVSFATYCWLIFLSWFGDVSLLSTITLLKIYMQFLILFKLFSVLGPPSVPG